MELTGDHNNILVSNTVGNNKLYLKIKSRKEKVVVAPKYNVSQLLLYSYITKSIPTQQDKSYFTLTKWNESWYSFMVNHLPGYALRYDEKKQEVVVSAYNKSNSSFHFKLTPLAWKIQP